MFEFKNVIYKNILNIPSFSIAEHKITTLVGKSGSGKTTILKLMNKLISPSEGEISFYGKNLSEIDSVLHRRQVTMLSQTPIIFDGNIKDNLTAGLRFQKREIADDSFLEEMLKKVKLTKELNAPADNLSGGEKQRLALGRVLLLDSPIYLLDEPSSALDEKTAEAIIEMITNYIRSKNKTLIMVTHSNVIADRYSDTIIEVLNGGAYERSL